MFLPYPRAASVGSFKRPVVAAADVTPDAVDWTDTTSTSGTATTIGQLITGISSSIILKLNVSGNGVYTASYGTNSSNAVPATFTTIGSGTPFTGDTSTFSVPNNTWLFFRFTRGSAGLCILTTTTVVNTSDSNTTLDTFTIKIGSKTPCP